MTPSKHLILLGFSIFLWLPPSLAAADADADADEEIASPADLAQLALTQREFQPKFEVRLRSQIDALIKDKLDHVLAQHTTQFLGRQTRAAAEENENLPAAMQAYQNDRRADPATRTPDTTCTMVGRTFECVLREVASR